MVGAAVSDTLPSTLTGATWTCAGAGGGTCAAASGSGSIATTVGLPKRWLAPPSWSVPRPRQGRPGRSPNTATVAAPASIADPIPANNSATDTDQVASDPRRLTVLDNFNRANANTLGANWSQGTFLGQAAIRVNTNQASDLLVSGTADLERPERRLRQSPGGGIHLRQHAPVNDACADAQGERWRRVDTRELRPGPLQRHGSVVIETTINRANDYTTRATLPTTFASGDSLRDHGPR